jgi:hypothetical protein
MPEPTATGSLVARLLGRARRRRYRRIEAAYVAQQPWPLHVQGEVGSAWEFAVEERRPR